MFKYYLAFAVFNKPPNLRICGVSCSKQHHAKIKLRSLRFLGVPVLKLRLFSKNHEAFTISYRCPSWNSVNSASVGSSTVNNTQDNEQSGCSVPNSRISSHPARTLQISMQSKYLNKKVLMNQLRE